MDSSLHILWPNSTQMKESFSLSDQQITYIIFPYFNKKKFWFFTAAAAVQQVSYPVSPRHSEEDKIIVIHHM